MILEQEANQGLVDMAPLGKLLHGSELGGDGQCNRLGGLEFK